MRSPSLPTEDQVNQSFFRNVAGHVGVTQVVTLSSSSVASPTGYLGPLGRQGKVERAQYGG